MWSGRRSVGADRRPLKAARPVRIGHRSGIGYTAQGSAFVPALLDRMVNVRKRRHMFGVLLHRPWTRQRSRSCRERSSRGAGDIQTGSLRHTHQDGAPSCHGIGASTGAAFLVGAKTLITQPSLPWHSRAGRRSRVWGPYCALTRKCPAQETGWACNGERGLSSI